MKHALAGFIVGALFVAVLTLGSKNSGHWLPRCDMSTMTPEHCYSVSHHPKDWRP